MWRLVPRPQVLLAFLTLLWPSLALGQQETLRVDYMFLIDTSGSMAGQAGHTNIFPAVKEAVVKFSRQLQPGTSVFMLPFDERVRGVTRFEVQQAGEVPGLDEYIRGLSASGTRTAVFDSIAQAVASASAHRKDQNGKSAVVFFVYTDGDDNVSKTWTLQTILKHFDLKRGPRDWMFYSELGLPPDRKKEQVFGQFERMRYISANEVHPIVHVQALLPTLDFGNLRDVPKATRAEKFSWAGTVPAAFNLAVEAEFPDVKAKGALVEVAPASLIPRGSVNLDLSLLNSLPDGSYRGRIHLKSSDPLVLVVPDTIDASFLYEPQHIVEVYPDVGTAFPLAFGRAGRAGANSPAATRVIRVRFNAPAVQRGDRLGVRIVQDSANPARLDVGKHLRVGGINAEEGWIAPTTEKISVIASLPATVKAGTYRGELLFESGSLMVKGLQQGKQPGTYALPWEITVARAPTPVWVWWLTALAFVSVGGYTAWRRLKPLTFTDLTLEVLAPARRSIALAGRSEMRLGKGGEELREAFTTFVIRARKDGRSNSASVEVTTGRMQIKRPGTKQEMTVVGEERLFDGDVLRFDDYRVRISSFTLIRQ